MPKKQTTRSVVIVGAGRMGSALGKLMSEAGHSVALWDADPSRVPEGARPLAETVPSADVVILCVPSFVVRQAVKDFAPLLSKRTLIVSVTKGMEAKTCLTMDELLPKLLPKGQPLALLGGPMLSEELEMGSGGAAAVGTKSAATFKTVQGLFPGSEVRLLWVSRPRSVAVAGVLKNVYALALGLADGLGWGWNKRGWLMGAIAAELAVVAPALRGEAKVALGPAGIGDLLATGFSPYSRNGKVAREFAKTGECPSLYASEGCVSIVSVWKSARTVRNQAPVLGALAAIFIQNQKPLQAFEALWNGGKR